MDSNSQADDSECSNAIYNIWNLRPAYTIPNTTYTIRGFSIAAHRTNFYIKELNIMLDGGLSSPYSPEHIFITHGHADHTANLPFHLYSKKENQKIQIYSPKEISQAVKEYIESAYILSSDVDFAGLNIKREEMYLYNFYDNIPVTPGENLMLTVKNKKYEIEIIKCIHSVPCVGYGFIEKRLKLKEEYKTLKGKEIGELKKSGVDINYEAEYPFFLFLGDTSKEILQDEKIKRYQTIMIECTFILDDDLDQADKTLHIHWKSLEPFIRENKDITFILYHFSQRYKKNELNEFFSKTDLTNIVPWIN